MGVKGEGPGAPTNSSKVDNILTKLPEIEHEATLFTSSGASILLPSDQKRHPMVFWLAILLVFTALLGFVNGADYIVDGGLTITPRTRPGAGSHSKE